MGKTDWELEEIIDEYDGNTHAVVRFHWDRSVKDLPNLRLDGTLFYPYTGNRHHLLGYYVRYVPADSRSIRTLGRMGGRGNGETIEVSAESWVNPGELFDAPGQGSAGQWR